MIDNELVVLLKRNPEIADLLSDMTSKKAKKLYVKAKHKHAIAQNNSVGSKYYGYWSTHVYVDGKRKAVLKATEDKIYDYLSMFIASKSLITMRTQNQNAK